MERLQSLEGYCQTRAQGQLQSRSMRKPRRLQQGWTVQRRMGVRRVWLCYSSLMTGRSLSRPLPHPLSRDLGEKKTLSRGLGQKKTLLRGLGKKETGLVMGVGMRMGGQMGLWQALQ